MSVPAGTTGSAAGQAAVRSRTSVLALDVGGTKLAAGVVDPDGAVQGFVVTPTLLERGPVDALDRLFGLARRAVDEAGLGWERIEAIGIGCGGPLDPERGVLIAPPHLPGWNDIPITSLATAALGRPAVLDNDATA